MGYIYTGGDITFIIYWWGYIIYWWGYINTGGDIIINTGGDNYINTGGDI